MIGARTVLFCSLCLNIGTLMPFAATAQTTTTNCTDWGYSIRCTTRTQPSGGTNVWLGALVGGLEGLAKDQERRRQEAQALEERRFVEAVLARQALLDAEAVARAAATARLFHNRTHDVLTQFADSLGLLRQSYSALAFQSDPVLRDLLLVEPRASYEVIREELGLVFRDFERRHNRFQELWENWTSRVDVQGMGLDADELIEVVDLIIDVRDQFMAGAIGDSDAVIDEAFLDWQERRRQLVLAEEARLRQEAAEEEARLRQEAEREREYKWVEVMRTVLNTDAGAVLAEAYVRDPWLQEVEPALMEHLSTLVEQGPSHIATIQTRRAQSQTGERIDASDAVPADSRGFQLVSLIAIEDFIQNRDLCLASEISRCNPSWLAGPDLQVFRKIESGQRYMQNIPSALVASWRGSGMPGDVYEWYRVDLTRAATLWLHTQIAENVDGLSEATFANQMDGLVTQVAAERDACAGLGNDRFRGLSVDGVQDLCKWSLWPAEPAVRLDPMLASEIQRRANAPWYALQSRRSKWIAGFVVYAVVQSVGIYGKKNGWWR